VRKLLALIVTPLVILAGCGGSGTTSGTSPPPPPPPPTQMIATPGPPNVESLVVDIGPNALTTPAVNTAFVTVTVCVPTTNNCQNIDHIEVDTGSVGLRILADATTCTLSASRVCDYTIPPGAFSLPLPAVPDPTTPGNVLAECLQFADGFSWGSVNTADIKLPVSGESATGVVVQVIGPNTPAGDPSKANPTCVPLPGSPLTAGLCGGVENTVPCFGANGILGVGPFITDCQSTLPCAPLAKNCNAANVCIPGNSATYFSCTSAASCTQTTANAPNTPPAEQLQNPGVLFAKDNNGVIVELPAVGASGAPAPLQGSLVFGIGTEGNNALGSATQLPADPSSGVISAMLNNTTYPFSYLDSGSNANFFPTTSTSLPNCPSPNDGFLCPAAGTTVSQNATLQGTDGTMLAADFSIVNADSLFAGSNVAFSNIAGSSYASGGPNNSLDLGLSFHYGRNVFIGFENVQTSAAPYFAY
jgi:hypothetical protein